MKDLVASWVDENVNAYEQKGCVSHVGKSASFIHRIKVYTMHSTHIQSHFFIHQRHTFSSKAQISILNQVSPTSWLFIPFTDMNEPTNNPEILSKIHFRGGLLHNILLDPPSLA